MNNPAYQLGVRLALKEAGLVGATEVPKVKVTAEPAKTKKSPEPKSVSLKRAPNRISPYAKTVFQSVK